MDRPTSALLESSTLVGGQKATATGPVASGAGSLRETWDGPKESTRRSIGTKLTVIARQLWRQFDQSTDALGVSRAKWRVIAAVARRPGATQRLIAELLEVTEVTAGRLVERLCADGYLERRENPSDRRAHCIYLTPGAQPLLDALSKRAAICEAEAFAGMDDQDLERLEALLRVVARNVSRSPETSRAQDPEGYEDA